MKGNTKLMMVSAFVMISLLVMPILTLNLPVKAQQAQNQTSPLLSLSKGADALIIIGILGLVVAIIVGIWMQMSFSSRVPSEPSFSILKTALWSLFRK